MILYFGIHKELMPEAQKAKQPSVLDVVDKVEHTRDSGKIEGVIRGFEEKGGNLDGLYRQLEFHLRLPKGNTARENLITASDIVSKIRKEKP